MNYNKIHKSFKLNGVSYSNETLLEKATTLLDNNNDFEAEIGRFLIVWLNNEANVKVKTSGSTGKPKELYLTKAAMKASALATGLFFNLKASQAALLCLPVSYIAGKMMLVRALVLGLEIDTIIPKINLDISKKKYDFVAMIPSQVEKNLDVLNQFSTLIIGGGTVSYSLKKALQTTTASVFETYGMTETITHIAIKPINKIDYKAYFKILPNISISTDNRNCLVINAPQLHKETIVTNDVVNLYSATQFEWLGRADNVINSGGVKLFPEKIEAKLEPFINNRFFISSIKDNTFGELAVLILEADSNQLEQTIFNVLHKTEIPKLVYAIPNFVETTSGKIQRKKTMQLL